MPLFAFEIEMVHPEYEVISSGIENLNNSDHIYYVIKIKRPIVNKLGIPKYGKTVKLNIVASTLYIQPIIIFSLLFSWPGFSIRERLKAALISVPFLIAMASIDIPPFFVSRIEMSFPVGSLSEQIRIMLQNFFSNGGRQFLALLAALVIIGLIHIMRTSTAISDLDPNDLCPCGSGKKYKRCCMK
ncbi:MAG: SEC-C domain-containing protein [Thermodesulfobacteriota bacterium]|nr:SEC-C domain-containing protein [Thermodesulfobacteriota bacterium]